jgi:probable HAF family extracellular repeat protein
VAIELATLGGPNSRAAFINDDGIIVGSAELASPQFGPPSHAVAWYGTTVVNLGTLGGPQSWASAVNASGLIVGAANTPTAPYPKATAWANSIPINLSTPQQLNASILAVNSEGIMVGLAEDLPFGGYYAAKWYRGTASRLPTPSSALESFAHSINSAGRIVGYINTTGGYRATLWEADSAIDLNVFLGRTTIRAGWILSKALFINSSGAIVGTAFNYLSIENRAFVLTPLTRQPNQP